MIENFKRKKENIIIILIYSLLSIIYFWPLIKGNQILAPGDAFVQNYPLRLYYSNLIKKGFPLWLPYQFIGTSFLGTMQTGVLYPLNFLYFFIPTEYAFNISLVLHFILAAFFTYIYVRNLGINCFPAFLSGIIFGFSGFLMAHKGHTQMVNAAIWVPLIFYLYDKIRLKNDRKYAIIVSIILGIQILAGHFQICVYTYVYIFVYILFYIMKVKDKRNFLLSTFIPIILGAFIALPQLVSTVELSKSAWRVGQGYEYFTEYSFPPFMILTLIFPYFFGGGYGLPYWGIGGVTETGGFVGVIAIVVSFLIIKYNWREQTTRFWAFILLISFLLCLGKYNPLYKVAYYLPVYNLFRVPSRHLFAFDFGISVLFGIGINKLLYGVDRKKYSYSIVKGIVLISIIEVSFVWFIKSAVLSYPSGKILSSQMYEILIKFVSINNLALIIPSVFIILYLVWVLIFNKYGSRLKKVFSFVLVLLVYLESFSFGAFHDYDLVKNYEINDQLNGEVVSFLNKNIHNYERVFSNNNNEPLFNVPLGISRLNGYDPLINTDLHKLLDMTPSGETSSFNRLIENNVILSSLNTKYILMQNSKFDPSKIYGSVQNNNIEEKPINIKNPEYINSTYKNNTITLKSSEGKSVSMLQYKISLKPYTNYLLRLKCKSNKTLDSSLSYDLYENGYDNSEQELDIDGNDITNSFRKFEKIINTGSNIPNSIFLRIFTYSEEAIEIKDVEIIELSNFMPPSFNQSQDDVKVEPNQLPLYKEVFESGTTKIYENLNCLPKAFTVENIRIANDVDDIKNQLYLLKINPSVTAVVNEKDFSQINSDKFCKGTASIVDYKGDYIEIDGDFSKGQGYLVLSDQYFPGWKAYIDGSETTIYKTNGMLRGIVVPMGKHKIIFKYTPMNIYISFLISILTISTCIIYLVYKGRMMKHVK